MTSSNSNNNNQDNRVVGLQVGDAKFYTRVSTLLAAGDENSYFHALFRENSYNIMFKESASKIPVYFVNRDGALFVHVLEFLRSVLHETPFVLPRTFQEDPIFWRKLRGEAVFFGLPELTQQLLITHTCEFNPNARGVLYWLGTNCGKDEEYHNPFSTGKVALGRYSSSSQKLKASQCTSLKTLVGTNAVQFRMPTYAYRWNSREPHIALHPLSCNVKLWYTGGKKPLVVDLRSASVRPTHVSIRSFFNFRGVWSFQCMQDKASDNKDAKWETLITLDGKEHTIDITNQMLQSAVLQVIQQDIRGRSGMSQARIDQLMVDTAEQLMRQTWKIEADADNTIAFYRYFRFVKEPLPKKGGNGGEISDDEDENNDSNEMVHNGVGIELFGDVHQD